MTWYQHKNWDEETHSNFYSNYRLAEKETQSIALIHQASLLCKHLDENTLKAGESLLILWMRDHFDKSKLVEVYSLMATICHRIGDHHRARDFEAKLKSISPK